MFIPKSDILNVLYAFDKLKPRHACAIESDSRSRLYIGNETPAHDVFGSKAAVDVTEVFKGFSKGFYNADMAAELVQDVLRLAE